MGNREEIPVRVGRKLKHFFRGKRCVVTNQSEDLCDWHHSDGNPQNSQDIANLVGLENSLNRTLRLPKIKCKGKHLPPQLEPRSEHFGLLATAKAHYWEGDIRLAYGAAKLATRNSIFYREEIDDNELAECLIDTSYYLRRVIGQFDEIENEFLASLLFTDFHFLNFRKLSIVNRLLLLGEFASWLNERGHPFDAALVFERRYLVTTNPDSYLSDIQRSTLYRQIGNNYIRREYCLSDVRPIVEDSFMGVNLSIQHHIPSSQIQAEAYFASGNKQDMYKGYEIMEEWQPAVEKTVYQKVSGMTRSTHVGTLAFSLLTTSVIRPKRKEFSELLKDGLRQIPENDMARWCHSPGVESLLHHAKANGVQFEKYMTMMPRLPNNLARQFMRLTSQV